jgi:peroxiredoxin
MKIELGKPAPDFSLFDSTKNKITLSDFRGKNVVLLFFPLAFTSTCTKELCFVRDNIGLYNDCDAIVFGISVDSPQTLAKYKEEQKLNFSLLSDFNREVSSLYDSLYESFSSMGMKGVSKRSVFMIDKEGILRYAEILDKVGELPDFEKIQLILESLT